MLYSFVFHVGIHCQALSGFCKMLHISLVQFKSMDGTISYCTPYQYTLYLCDAPIIYLAILFLGSFGYLSNVDVFSWPRIELDGHAQSTVHHIVVACLCAISPMCHLQARRRVHGTIDSGHLKQGAHSTLLDI